VWTGPRTESFMIATGWRRRINKNWRREKYNGKLFDHNEASFSSNIYIPTTSTSSTAPISTLIDFPRPPSTRPSTRFITICLRLLPTQLIAITMSRKALIHPTLSNQSPGRLGVHSRPVSRPFAGPCQVRPISSGVKRIARRKRS
jgi:hypothetical protein